MKSVTQERDLDEFLSTAELAGTEFTAGRLVTCYVYDNYHVLLSERRNIKIIQQTTSASQNPYLLSDQEEGKMVKKHEENKKRLRVPRRPAWNKTMTTEELDKNEKTAFLAWRRGLAE